MNKIFLMGRLTADVNVSYTKDNKAVGRYTVAVEDGFGDKKTTDFINCVAFGKSAEFAEKYFHKGQRVLVEGKLKISDYTDKDGNKKKSTTVWVVSQEFADGKAQAKEETNIDDVFSNSDDEELPFA